MTQEHIPFVFPIQLGSPSADAATLAGAYFYAHRKCKILSAVVVNSAAVNADDSNFIKLELKNGTKVVASLDTRSAQSGGHGALEAHKAKEMALNSANVVIDKGSTLTVNYDETDAGTNVALTNAVMIVTGFWIGSAD